MPVLSAYNTNSGLCSLVNTINISKAICLYCLIIINVLQAMCSSENVCVWVCACGGAISPHTICVTVGEANLLVTGLGRYVLMR